LYEAVAESADFGSVAAALSE
jgi:hypothetical protein